MASTTPSVPNPNSPTLLRRSITSPAKTTERPSPPPASPPQPRRSISFHVRSRDISEGHRMKWDSEMEARLQAAERELKLAQRSWSERQEDWIEEVETLRELRRESEKFYRRRQKLMRNEGMRWWREVVKNKDTSFEEEERSSGGEDDGDEGTSCPGGKGLGAGGLQQRITSFPVTGRSTPNSTFNGSSQSSSRKSSVVGKLIRAGMFKRRDSV